MAKDKEDLLVLDEPEGDVESEKVDAAEDIIKAVKEGDASALSMALERHWALCEQGEGKGEGEPDGDEPGYEG